MLNIKYISSKGVEYDLLTNERMITECDAFDYSFSPVTFGKRYGSKIYGFEMEQKEFEATFYVFGVNRKQYLNELFAAFDYDVMNEKIGTLVCNGYSIPAYSIASSDGSQNSSSLLWDTFKRRFLCPYPFWSKQTQFKLFNVEDIEPLENIKDYLPVSENGKADYPFDLATNTGTSGYLINEDLIGSEFVLTINGEAINPEIRIGDMKIALNVSIAPDETLTIDSRSKTVVLNKQDGTKENCYGNRDVSVDIFQKIPYGTIDIHWNDYFSFTIATYDERTAPLWN